MRDFDFSKAEYICGFRNIELYEDGEWMAMLVDDVPCKIFIPAKGIPYEDFRDAVMDNFYDHVRESMGMDTGIRKIRTVLMYERYDYGAIPRLDAFEKAVARLKEEKE